MDNVSRLKVFKAQTQNTRTLLAARIQIRRMINSSLRTGNRTGVTVQTRILALLFCAWAEANFSKVIHTPHGFSLDEISQIKKCIREGSIVAGWHKAIELALGKTAARAANFVPNTKRKLHAIAKTYVEEPSLLRNKIAHGQWTIALNKENSNENEKLSNELDNLTIVSIDLWFEAHERLANLLETLIESPNKAFMRDYWPIVVDLENTLANAATRTLERHIEILRRKNIRLRPA